MDDRALLTLEETVAQLRRDQDDRFSTLLARASRLPTGTMLPTLATVPPPGTLLLHGQTVQRADYPDLWAWTEATAAGGFVRTATTLALPDTRGRVLRGTPASGETVGQQVGADSRTLTEAQMPVHGHTGSTGSAGAHIHDTANGEMGLAGGHGGHFPGTQFNAAAGTDLGLAAWNSGGASVGGHNHFFTLDITSGGAHSHSVSIGTAGSGQAFDNRPASLNGHYLIWT